jgi:3-methyl-2-oxobutanoate hydroxymethyltransferase
MSKHVDSRRITVPEIRARKGREKIVCLTAYTAPMAALLDEHVDLLLVGDSLGMVVHGLPNTVGVTLDMMILHGQAVMRAASLAPASTGTKSSAPGSERNSSQRFGPR